MEIPDWWQERSPYFKPSELLSLEGLKLFEQGYLPIQLEFLDYINNFREYLGKPIKVNTATGCRRGFRTVEENGEVLGAGKSWHVKGMAADINVVGMSLEDLYTQSVKFGFTGVGLYLQHVHIDIGIGKQRQWRTNNA